MKPADQKAPTVRLTTPEALSTVNTNDIQFTGTITDESEISEFTIAGEAVELTYDQEKKQYTF